MNSRPLNPTVVLETTLARLETIANNLENTKEQAFENVRAQNEDGLLKRLVNEHNKLVYLAQERSGYEGQVRRSEARVETAIDTAQEVLREFARELGIHYRPKSYDVHKCTSQS